MPRTTKGSIYPVKGGFRIRWVDGTRRPTSGQTFRTRRDARVWWDEKIGPRLRRGGPSPEITFQDFTAVYLERWDVDKAIRTRTTLREWLKPSLTTFGSFTLAELEGALDDIARWRSSLPSEDKRHKATRALRQVLAAAVRWGYMARNAALDAGQNPAPRPDEIHPFTRQEIGRLCEEMAPQHAALVVLVAETGLRTNEWTALERRDVDRQNPAVAVVRRFSRGVATPYPKTVRRRVPLTPRAEEALSWLPVRLDSPLLFPSPDGQHMCLDNWRLRIWKPSLEAAEIEHRGPYQLRHTFATNALRAGVSIFDLSKLMAASVKTIERHYAQFAQDSEGHLRGLLSAGGEIRDEETG